MKNIALAADLGGTNLRMAAISEEGKILYRTRRETPSTENAEQILQTIVGAADECRRAVLNQGEVFAISTAVPGTVNAAEGIILKAPNIPALNNYCISEKIKSELKLLCVLENDANASAVGENWLGASKDFQNSICITLGTGVGGGIILDGKVLRGIDGTAGEIGHVCVEPFGVPCGCGSNGCLEQYSSATAIVRLTRDLSDSYPKSDLNEKNPLTSLEIYEAGKSGDVLALEVFRRQGFFLGIVLAGLINVLNPEVIVIGGGAAAGWDLFVASMIEQINKRTYKEPAKRAKIVRARLGDNAGILGAARLAFNKVSGLASCI
jgi:glucokinase